MKYLVTGATSGLGRNAVEWLINKGQLVHATGRNAHAGKAIAKLGATFTQLDLVTASDDEIKKLLKDCQVVWHCAALSSPWGSYDSFYQANVSVTERLARLSGELDVNRFIHISTPSIYFDFQSQQNIPESYIAKKFANHYASTKYLAEQVITNMITTYPKTTYIMLRPRGLFGPHDRVIVPRVLRQIERTKQKLPLPAGGKAYIDLTFVLNAVYAMWLATHNTVLTSGKVFNITNQQPAQLSDVLYQLISVQLGINYKIKSLPYSLLYGLASTLECCSLFTKKEPILTRYSVGALYFDMTLCQKQAKEQLGYTPIYTLEQGIIMTADWFKQQGTDTFVK